MSRKGHFSMRSGPALRQITSHRAIHDAGQAQARELTEMMKQLFNEEREEDCLKTAKVLIEHWEERIIAHADAEDEGFYQELLAEDKIPKKDIYMLMRDHDLFRKIVAHIKEQINVEKKVTEQHIHEFYALLTINHFHHKGEEDTLFPD